MCCPVEQVSFHNGLLLHEPETISINMTQWKGHFGTLMPFYHACERAGGFIGKRHPVKGTPGKLPGGDTPVPHLNTEVGLDALGLYRPPRRSNGEVVDWAAPIRSARARLVANDSARSGADCAMTLESLGSNLVLLWNACWQSARSANTEHAACCAACCPATQVSESTSDRPSPLHAGTLGI
jgi:hypothetical protein